MEPSINSEQEVKFLEAIAGSVKNPQTLSFPDFPLLLLQFQSADLADLALAFEINWRLSGRRGHSHIARS
jgi:hypothetical protein